MREWGREEKVNNQDMHLCHNVGLTSLSALQHGDSGHWQWPNGWARARTRQLHLSQSHRHS